MSSERGNAGRSFPSIEVNEASHDLIAQKGTIVTPRSPTRTRVAVVAIAAMSAALLAACRQTDDITSEPDARSVQQALGGQPGGGLEGTTRASYPANGTLTVPLPEVDVWAQNVVTGVVSPMVKSDYNGHYYIFRPSGNYKICWSKAGFTSACTSATFHVANSDVTAGINDVVVSTSNVLRGHITLSDLSKCLNVDALFGIRQSAVAEVVNGANAVLKSTEPNAQGEFVVPWDTSALTLRVSCGQAVQTFVSTQMDLDLTGRTSLPVTINNKRPGVNPIAASVGGVDARQGVAPGTVVSLVASATDPDGDQLTYHWRAPVNAGTLPDTGAATATWTLPVVPGTYSAYVSVDDNKGGFASRQVEVTVSSSGTVLFSGTVHDSGKNGIVGATISIGSQNATSDALGNFSLSVPQSTVYLVNIEKAGYAEMSKRMTQPATGREYILSDSFKQAINPLVTNVITDQRTSWLSAVRTNNSNLVVPPPPPGRIGGSVTLPANSLDLRTRPVGQLFAYITTFDPITEDLPGDMSAVNASHASVFLVTYGAVFIEIRDSANNKFNLAAGKTATVDIPIQSPLQNDPGATPTIATWTFDVPSGNWIQLPGIGTRVGNVYRLTVSHFSTKNADIQKANPACVRVLLGSGVPTTLKAFINLELTPTAPRRRDVDLGDTTNTIYNLPPATPYTLEVFDATGVLLNTLNGNTGAAWGGVGIPPDSAVCDTKTLTSSILGTPGSSTAFSRFLFFKGTGDLATADGYYKGIDPNSLRVDLKGFFANNGFGPDGSGGTRTSFINNNDLGFGRDAYCKQTGSNVACYVSNYGGPDQNPGNFIKAKDADKPTVKKTVAMEYSPIEGQDPTIRVVKFYVYDGACTAATLGCGATNSPRSPSANLDGAGEKFVPNLCTTCHGGGYYFPVDPAAPTFAEVNNSSSFLPFDIASYRDGTAGPKPSDPAFGLVNIRAQDTDFHTQNKMVLATNPVQPIQDIISLFYPSGAAKFNEDAIPCGWRAKTTDTVCNGSFSGGTGNVATETLYRDVVAQACRSCHMAQRSDIAWDTYRKFANNHGTLDPPGTSGSQIAGLVCNTGLMPHTNVTWSNFWRSNLPHRPDTLKSFSMAAANADAPAWTAFGSCAPAL